MKLDYVYRRCFREPIPEIYDAAQLLNDAVEKHIKGDYKHAEELISLANMPIIREWTESIWGKGSVYTKKTLVSNAPIVLPKELRIPVRMPNTSQQQLLHERDGFHCRFCGIPVIRKEIRVTIQKSYPKALQWGKINKEQHAGFQAMWLQYDHLLPHSRGGNNELNNIVITCAPCNFGRMENTLEEVGLSNPFDREPTHSSWDGLERFLKFIPETVQNSVSASSSS